MTDSGENQPITGEAPRTSQALFDLLKQLDIRQETIQHPPLRTVEEAKTVRPRTDGGYTKNLFVRNKKADMWLLTLHEDRQLDLKATALKLSAKSFTFGRPERLMRHLGVMPGAVSPFALVNDTLNEVRFAIDSALLEYEVLHIHPLDNRMTTTVATGDLLRFLEHTGHTPIVLEMGEE